MLVLPFKFFETLPQQKFTEVNPCQVKLVSGWETIAIAFECIVMPFFIVIITINNDNNNHNNNHNIIIVIIMIIHVVNIKKQAKFSGSLTGLNKNSAISNFSLTSHRLFPSIF